MLIDSPLALLSCKIIYVKKSRVLDSNLCNDKNKQKADQPPSKSDMGCLVWFLVYVAE